MNAKPVLFALALPEVGGSFSASPVGADGCLYIASEDGEIFVLAAAPWLAQIAKNDMKEVINHVYGIGQ